MNGRHVSAPQGAEAIQNPAYRPAGIFSFYSRWMRWKAAKAIQECLESPDGFAA
jgi:hypothetical protein